MQRILISLKFHVGIFQGYVTLPVCVFHMIFLKLAKDIFGKPEKGKIIDHLKNTIIS